MHRLSSPLAIATTKTLLNRVRCGWQSKIDMWAALESLRVYFLNPDHYKKLSRVERWTSWKRRFSTETPRHLHVLRVEWKCGPRLHTWYCKQKNHVQLNVHHAMITLQTNSKLNKVSVSVGKDYCIHVPICIITDSNLNETQDAVHSRRLCDMQRWWSSQEFRENLPAQTRSGVKSWRTADMPDLQLIYISSNGLNIHLQLEE